MKLIPRLQPIVVLILFIAFLLIFGINAYNKYKSYEVYIKETVVEHPDGLEAPAMTICVDAVRKEESQYNFSKSIYRDLPFMPERRISHLSEGTGFPGWQEKQFVTKQLVLWMTFITAWRHCFTPENRLFWKLCFSHSVQLL